MTAPMVDDRTDPTPQCVAEFGQSHRGDIRIAIKQIEAAKQAGAHAVKFQTFDPAEVASARAVRYWNADLGGHESQLDTFADNGMLPREAWPTLSSLCDSLGVEFLSTPFSLRAVDELEPHVRRWKVASGDITYRRLLEHIAATGKPVMLSTGAATEDEIDRALDWLEPVPVVLLACTLSYPCPDDEAHLGRIEGLRRRFFHRCQSVGYSDHTTGTTTSFAAAALGATVLEKHCTLSADGPVPDDGMALTPEGLARYVTNAQRGAVMRGDPTLTAKDCEQAAFEQARRSVCAARPIREGQTLTADDLVSLRPGGGVHPQYEPLLDGTEARRDYGAGEALDSGL